MCHSTTGKSSLRPARLPPRPRGAFPLGGPPRLVLDHLSGQFRTIHTGLHLFSTLRLRGTVYTDCLSAVKKINRRWSPGSSFHEADAALVASCRANLSDSISLKWIKGHPERSEQPPAAWSRHQWGIYLTDAISRNRDTGSLAHSPIPTLRILTFFLPDILTAANPLNSWQWVRSDGTPPLGNLRSMLSHHRVLAYRSHRDSLRHALGAPPIWLDSQQSVGPAALSQSSQPLRQRVQALRSLRDLRWHGENRAVAAHSTDPQVSNACLICRRLWNQAHVLCDCSSTSGARAAGSLDLTVAIGHLSPGPMQELDRATSNDFSPYPTNLPSSQWDHAAIEALQPEITRCSRKQITAVLGHIGRITCATTTACWRDFII